MNTSNKYNPNIHHRKSIRLKGYDYSQAGAYFITHCVQYRRCVFGKIKNGEMFLNTFGQIANDQWHELPKRFNNIELDEFIVMPNHIHGIIIITEPPVGATLAVAPNTENAVFPNNMVSQNNIVIINNNIENNDGATINSNGATARVAPTIGNIVGAYKSLVVHHCLEYIKINEPETILGKLWQRNYHEHIIRNEQSYQRISQYIINNPKNWDADKFYNSK